MSQIDVEKDTSEICRAQSYDVRLSILNSISAGVILSSLVMKALKLGVGDDIKTLINIRSRGTYHFDCSMN